MEKVNIRHTFGLTVETLLVVYCIILSFTCPQSLYPVGETVTSKLYLQGWPYCYCLARKYVVHLISCRSKIHKNDFAPFPHFLHCILSRQYDNNNSVTETSAKEKFFLGMIEKDESDDDRQVECWRKMKELPLVLHWSVSSLLVVLCCSVVGMDTGMSQLIME